MLNKEQALAAMDAQIIRVEAEQRRRLERRVGRLSVIYPALRRVPLEERAALRDEASRYVLRRWTIYVAMVLIMAFLCLFLLREQIFGIRPISRAPDLIVMFASYASMILVIHLHKHFWLKHAVASRYGDSGPPGHG